MLGSVVRESCQGRRDEKFIEGGVGQRIREDLCAEAQRARLCVDEWEYYANIVMNAAE